MYIHRLESNLLLFLIVLLMYKNIISIFSSAIFVSLFVICLIFLNSIFVLKIVRGKIRWNLTKLLVVGLIVWVTVSFVSSVFIDMPGIELSHKITTFRQFFIPLLLILLVINIEITSSFIRKVFYFSIPILIFAVAEIFFLKDFVEKVFYMAMSDQAASFETSAYFFWEFGHPIRRVGSLFFEPLMYGIFCAFLFVSLTLVKAHWFNRVVVFFLGAVALVKSFYIFMIFAFFVKSKIRFYGAVSTVFLIPLVMVVFSLSMDQEEMLKVFLTLGNHIHGLVSGILNGFTFPFLGHGLGTSGFLNEIQNLKDGGSKIEMLNSYFHDPYLGNGNESGLGIMVYQFGYVFTALFIYMQLHVMFKLTRARQYLVSSVFLGSFVLFLFSESFYTILVFIYPYLLYSFVLRGGERNA